MDACQDATAYCCFSLVQPVSAAQHTKVTSSSGSRHRTRLTGFHWHLALIMSMNFPFFLLSFLALVDLNSECVIMELDSPAVVSAHRGVPRI